jgi:hypothetical protein
LVCTGISLTLAQVFNAVEQYAVFFAVSGGHFRPVAAAGRIPTRRNFNERVVVLFGKFIASQKSCCRAT